MSRRTATWIFIALVFMALVIAAAVGADRAPTRDEVEARGVTYESQVMRPGSGPDVAVVLVEGVIVNGVGSPGDGNVGGDSLIALLDRLDRDNSISGVILELNTPGGAVLASAEVADRVRKLKDDGTPVVAWMRDSAASGGYYIAAGTSRIVAHESTITGSIGVILTYLNIEGLAQKVGIKPVVIKSGELKDMGSPFTELSDKERSVLQGIIDQAYASFVDTVAAGRDMPKSRVRELADGRIYTGLQARRNGLVDEIGGSAAAIDEIEDLLEEDDVNVVRYQPSYGLLDALGLASARNDALAKVATGLTSGVVPGAVAGAGAGTPGHPGALPNVEYRAVL